MRWVWIGASIAAGGLLLVLLLWTPGGPPSNSEVHRRLLAHPEMAPYAEARADILPLAPEDLSRLAAEQPAVFGSLPASSTLYRVELYAPAGDALLLIYDAGEDRILRTFHLLSGRLE